MIQHKSLPNAGKQPRVQALLTASQENLAHLNTKGSTEHYERWKQGQMFCVFFCQGSCQKLEGQEQKPSTQPHCPFHGFKSSCFVDEGTNTLQIWWLNKRCESPHHVRFILVSTVLLVLPSFVCYFIVPNSTEGSDNAP